MDYLTFNVVLCSFNVCRFDCRLLSFIIIFSFFLNFYSIIIFSSFYMHVYL